MRGTPDLIENAQLYFAPALKLWWAFHDGRIHQLRSMGVFATYGLRVSKKLSGATAKIPELHIVARRQV